MHGSPGLHPALCVRCIALPCGLGGPRVVGIGAIHNIRSAMLVAPRVRLDLKGALEERPRHPLARRHSLDTVEGRVRHGADVNRKANLRATRR
jgi:hypothetical protein